MIAFKKMPLAHFLSAGKAAIMCFLMACMEEPVRSLRSVMAVMIPALYDMVDEVDLLSATGKVTVGNEELRLDERDAEDNHRCSKQCAAQVGCCLSVGSPVI